MYYVLYLSSLCKRRHWPDPLYTTSPSPAGPDAGYTCIVRVNNREYQTDTIHATEPLARENAAMRAYLICRNFSVNDGMYPQGHDHGGVVQGVPVAIGTGRVTGTTANGMGTAKYQHHRRQMDGFGSGSSGSSGSGGSGSGSGGSSPESQTQFYDGFGLGRA